jgi:hypothetical protein
MLIRPNAGPGPGLDFYPEKRICLNKTGGAVAKGDIVMMDRQLTGDATNNLFNDVLSGYACFITPVATNATTLRSAYFGMVLAESCADDAECWILFCGPTNDLRCASAVNPAINVGLKPLTTVRGATTLAVTGGQRIIAVTTAAATGAAGTVPCDFDGIHGSHGWDLPLVDTDT